MPPSTRLMPIQVSRDITFPSAHHSPSTVNKKASEFVIGTVSESSAGLSVSQKETAEQLNATHRPAQ